MFLTLSMVKIEGAGKKQTSRIIVSRVNMDHVISYFEAPKEVRENANEKIRANTFMMLDLEGNRVYSVIETVDEIDDMVGSYGSEIEKEPTPTVPLEIKSEVIVKNPNVW
jgi:hypothetical protein